MIRLARSPFGSRQGGTLALVAVSIAALLGMAALAVDLTAGFAWRNEAQKIADSGALAGGSAFLDLPELQAEPEARSRAIDYALRHTIKDKGSAGLMAGWFSFPLHCRGSASWDVFGEIRAPIRMRIWWKSFPPSGRYG